MMQTQFLNSSIDATASLLPLAASAIVFDCDGLLADTEELWLRAVAECASRWGLTLGSLGDFRGAAIDDAATQLGSALTAAGMSTPPFTTRVAVLTTAFDGLIARDAAAMPGAIALVRDLAQRLPLAVASNSPRTLLDQILTRIGLESLIACSVARDEVSAGKPAPELYVAALRKLQQQHPFVNAETAVAFEDSAVGALAATGAGFLVVGVNLDEAVHLTCHVRLSSLRDPELVNWARVVQQDVPVTDAPATFASGSFEGATGVLTVACQYPAGQAARVDVFAQRDCTWDELPSVPPIASASVVPCSGSVTLQVGHLPAGAYRYLLVTDGVVPYWNGRTGEFRSQQRADSPVPVPVPDVPGRAEHSADVMTWNLWFGGTHSNDGHAKQVRYLQNAAHTIVALQECFGDYGRQLAATMGWNIAQQGHDTAVISPYAVSLHDTETAPFATCATVFTPAGAVTVWSVHLWHSDYGPYTATNGTIPARFTLASRGERLRIAQLARILSEQSRLERDGVVSGDNPVILMGDFNVPSHLDWTKDNRAGPVEWPTSHMLEIAGYLDTFRVVHPDAGSVPGDTWSPIIPPEEEPRDRIDFIFSRGARTTAADTVDGRSGVKAVSEYCDSHRTARSDDGLLGQHLDNDWPTDHAAVVATLTWDHGSSAR